MHGQHTKKDLNYLIPAYVPLHIKC